MRGWLTAKADPLARCPNEPQFNQKVRHICGLYQQAPDLAQAGEVVFSSDEMTGLQALGVVGATTLERLHPDKPMQPGQPVKREFEYIRHGTMSLTIHREVATGKVISPFAAPTCEEEDFVLSVVLAISERPEATRWHFVWVVGATTLVDNLNIHQSESLVRLVAGLEGKPVDLGCKGKHGILYSMVTRAEYLSELTHRLVFYYTPKHASWMNQVEMWLSILARKVLKRGSFQSVEDLREKIWSFIEYYNAERVGLFKWTYQGKPLES